MTTLNLVLTIEINDHLEKKMSDREAEEASDNDDKKDEDGSNDDEEGATEANKTQEQNTTKEGADDKEGSEDEADQDAVPTMAGKKNKERIEAKVSPEDQRRKLYDELFGPDFKPDARLSKALENAKREIKQKKLKAT